MTVVGTSYFDTWANYQVGYDLVSQDAATNTSTVTFYGVLNVTGNSISWSSGNASVWGTSNSLNSYYSNGSYVVVQQTVTITHNMDGTYTNTLTGTISTSYTSGTAQGTFSLPKLSQFPILVNGMDFNDEQNVVYNIMSFNTYPIRVKLEVGGDTNFITRDIAASFSGNYTLELSSSERTRLRQACTGKTLSVIETVCAMDGNTELSASYKQYTMTMVNAEPTFTATYQDTNATTIAITNNNQQIIRNNSTLQINLTNISPKKSATISRVFAEINGTTYNGTFSGTTGTISVGALDISSNITGIVRVADSRGYVTAYNMNITILDWQIPTGIVSCQRQNNYYAETDVKVDANYSSLDSKNVITLKVRSKKTTDGSYGAYTTLSDNVTTTLTLDNLYAWDVQFLVQDLIGSTTYNLTIDKGIPIVFFDRLKRSVGIDCFPENTTSLEVGGTDIIEELGTKQDIYDLVPDGNEVKTGRKINGSDEYAKMYSTSFPSGVSSFAHNITNFTLTEYSGIAYDGSMYRIPTLEVSDTLVYIYTSANMGSGTVTLKYTKN